jgi:transposase
MRGHRYLRGVVHHDRGRVVGAAAGRNAATRGRFFDLLGAARAGQITHVTADAADWIAQVVAERCPNAQLCADAFHVVAWATEALDEQRRRAWNDARGGNDRAPGRGNRRQRTTSVRAQQLKRARWALWKNPENLTDRQRHKLEWIAKTDPTLWRAYLLKEGLRLVFALKGEQGKQALDRWISWARRSRIPSFVELQRRIIRHRTSIDAALDSGLSNALVESTNTKIRLITRMAFGFHGPEPLIALAMLSLGSHPPLLPGRG